MARRRNPRSGETACGNCRGTGKILDEPGDSDGLEEFTCSECGGSGCVTDWEI